MKVKLGGLPWKATKSDIASFLKDCNILGYLEGITIVMNEYQKPSGDAFVELETENDLKTALTYNKKCLFGRFVTVDVAITNNKHKTKLSNECISAKIYSSMKIKLGGLPWKATKSDIASFLKDCNLVNGLE